MVSRWLLRSASGSTCITVGDPSVVSPSPGSLATRRLSSTSSPRSPPRRPSRGSPLPAHRAAAAEVEGAIRQRPGVRQGTRRERPPNRLKVPRARKPSAVARPRAPDHPRGSHVRLDVPATGVISYGYLQASIRPDRVHELEAAALDSFASSSRRLAASTAVAGLLPVHRTALLEQLKRTIRQTRPRPAPGMPRSLGDSSCRRSTTRPGRLDARGGAVLR